MVIRRAFYNAFSSSPQALFARKINSFQLGQYPSCMDYSRPFEVKRSSKGICVASEQIPSPLVTINFFINCGSRNETVASSGTAHFLEHLHFKGTSNRTRNKFELDVQNIGANLNAYTSRENTCYTITVPSSKLRNGISIVGDMISNSLYRAQDVENERSTIHRELQQTRISMPLETTLQMSHQGMFPTNQIGLPILGKIQNINTISRPMIQVYHRDNYIPENIFVTAVGQVDHALLAKYVDEYVNVQGNPNAPQVAGKRTDIVKPEFNSGIGSMEFSDFEKYRLECVEPGLSSLVNMVVVREAPSFFDKDFFYYLVLQRILADKPENSLQMEFMKDSSLFRYQNRMNKLQFVKKQRGFYSSYWDTGIFGDYFQCTPKDYAKTIARSLDGYADYATSITEEELQRAKRRIYVEVLQQQTQDNIGQSISNNLMYYGRRVHMKEIAQRVSVITTRDIQNIAQKIVDQTNSMYVMLWGNTAECFKKQ